jgi:hypothetical protein
MNKKLLTVAVGATLALAGSAANAAFEAKVSGHLVRGVMIADDGADSQTYHVDIGAAPSRFRITASDELVPGIKAGVLWEMGFNSNFSNNVTQTKHSQVNSVSAPGTTNSAGTTTNLFVNERQQEVYFQGAFGTLKFGHGDGATKDGNAIDLSGTALFNGGQPSDWGGALNFRDASTGALTTSTVSGMMTAYEGSRFDRIRYDSPALGGIVTVSASTGYQDNNDWTDFAVRLNTDLGAAGKLAAAVYYNKIATTQSAEIPITNGNGNQENSGISASWLAPMGFNVTLAYATREDEHPTAPLDGKFYRIKLGYTTGEHSVSADYAKSEDQVRSGVTILGDEGTEYSLAYSWKPKTWAEIIAGVKVFSLDRPGANFEDITVVGVGSRLVF